MSAFKKFRRYAIISIEIIAGIGACFAFYEIFFARKTVDYASLSFDLCAPLSDQHTDFSEFLARNAEKFVVLDLEFTQRPLQCVIPGTNGWSAYLSPDQASVTLEVQSDKYGYQRVPDFGLQGYSTILTFQANELRDHVLNDVYGEWAEDPGYISISGAFFVKPSVGEGDLYFNLIPAPFDVQTDLISRCTRVANTQSGWNRIQKYISECIL
ncbi:hypothetical protein [Yoonia maritima]|uniref:hypothetical protein n=1 Tax=Yoonia maritima TaxID=1435347 RepID=UPI0037363278